MDGWMEEGGGGRKGEGETGERITICTRSSFSSKNTHSLQIFGYQVLWLGGRPKCTERECSARRQHRKTHPVPKHRRPEQSQAWMGRSESHPRCSRGPDEREKEAPGFEVCVLSVSNLHWGSEIPTVPL